MQKRKKRHFEITFCSLRGKNVQIIRGAVVAKHSVSRPKTLYRSIPFSIGQNFVYLPCRSGIPRNPIPSNRSGIPPISYTVHTVPAPPHIPYRYTVTDTAPARHQIPLTPVTKLPKLHTVIPCQGTPKAAGIARYELIARARTPK